MGLVSGRIMADDAEVAAAAVGAAEGGARLAAVAAVLAGEIRSFLIVTALAAPFVGAMARESFQESKMTR